MQRIGFSLRKHKDLSCIAIGSPRKLFNLPFFLLISHPSVLIKSVRLFEQYSPHLAAVGTTVELDDLVVKPEGQ